MYVQAAIVCWLHIRDYSVSTFLTLILSSVLLAFDVSMKGAGFQGSSDTVSIVLSQAGADCFDLQQL